MPSPITTEISILAVLADRDMEQFDKKSILEIFQSSRSLRTATRCWWAGRCEARCISILAVLADRDVGLGPVRGQLTISILAVLADRDFLCSQPARLATLISILAVLADRDFRHSYRRSWPLRISILAVLADRDYAF